MPRSPIIVHSYQQGCSNPGTASMGTTAQTSVPVVVLRTSTTVQSLGSAKAESRESRLRLTANPVVNTTC
jgi:hypothetical protein